MATITIQNFPVFELNVDIGDADEILYRYRITIDRRTAEDLKKQIEEADTNDRERRVVDAIIGRTMPCDGDPISLYKRLTQYAASYDKRLEIAKEILTIVKER